MYNANELPCAYYPLNTAEDICQKKPKNDKVYGLKEFRRTYRFQYNGWIQL